MSEFKFVENEKSECKKCNVTLDNIKDHIDEIKRNKKVLEHLNFINDNKIDVLKIMLEELDMIEELKILETDEKKII
jgi:hypothetical protein